MNRRTASLSLFGTVAAFALRQAQAADTAQVTVVLFNDSGVKLGTSSVKKVVKSDAEWKSLLPAGSFSVARKAGTERPFTSPLNNVHDAGLFRCICCEHAALRVRSTKFDSGTGWPSFWRARREGERGRPTTTPPSS